MRVSKSVMSISYIEVALLKMENLLCLIKTLCKKRLISKKW